MLAWIRCGGLEKNENWVKSPGSHGRNRDGENGNNCVRAPEAAFLRGRRRTAVWEACQRNGVSDLQKVENQKLRGKRQHCGAAF